MAIENQSTEKMDGYYVAVQPQDMRADIVLDRPPYNIVSMAQRDQLRETFEALAPSSGG